MFSIYLYDVSYGTVSIYRYLTITMIREDLPAAGSLMCLETVPVAVDAMLEIGKLSSWKARISVLEFLQVSVFSNFAAFVRLPEQVTTYLLYIFIY
jgi:hypothetical protein